MQVRERAPKPHPFGQYPKLSGTPRSVVAVGLDLSLRSTGMAVYGHGHIYRERVIPGDMRGLRRLFYIRKRIIDFVLAQISLSNTVSVFIEGYSYASANQAHQIGELGGIIRTDLAQFDFDVFTIPPNSLKLFITADGKAKKSKMVLQLFKRWDIEVDQEDEADAVGLAIMGAMFKVPGNECWPGHQVKGSEKISRIWGSGWKKY